jgi:hypothetical protein
LSLSKKVFEEYMMRFLDDRGDNYWQMQIRVVITIPLVKVIQRHPEYLIQIPIDKYTNFYRSIACINGYERQWIVHETKIH